MKLPLNKWVAIGLTVSLLLALITSPVKAEGLSVSARSAILMEQESGRILFEKDAYSQRRIASITKVMTAILAIESGKMDDMVTVSKRAVYTEGSSIYLKQGEKIKLEDLVYGLMLRSGNDAAVAIAEHVGGSLEGFVHLMNEKAKELGMTKTVFSNPHGLDDHEQHFSTAYDMALLTRYAMQNKKFQKISGTKRHSAPNPEEKWDRKWRNKNKLLTELYEYSTGGKTGFTKRARRTLISTAEKDGMELIAVTLDDPDDWDDHISMFNWAYDKFNLVPIIEKGKIDEIKDDPYKGKVFSKKSFLYPLKDDEIDFIDTNIKLIKPPGKKGWREEEKIPSPIGTFIVKLEQETIASIPLYYDVPAKKDEKGFWEFFRGIFSFSTGFDSNG
ncbi:D-alanyl-D-alanine carboxypeptidase family protein [Pseudalkalibacillus caeni]|uniref:D-alanyl-D-alanine carboxypeptidase n=1 Tax=Exobacillus caeni TaxID=2574798 RepID=A0A5R9F779_9BACL|nr:D-alanyl-D-alanine carboxypeptidase family protein [Pseudalkalibacillus caeni]TLS35635.1 D-alanyl-D-alanine carboxypeptidase [Pseudalkalibacillus caeni]